ncbi:MAG: helix-turn-helix transcriptional regulator [Eubacteriales bacterium]|nr:helix-turn-helix transcriptional regulator [Eubacteriales bacterium]
MAKELTTGFEENLKKALSEMLILYVLSEKPRYIGEITETIKQRNNGVFEIVCPYSAIYRLLDQEYITELKKCIAPDGRRRQYYVVSDIGKEYLNRLIQCYEVFTNGVQAILYPERTAESENTQAG